MERIVTKIGDVTIERRISKPKAPLENSFGSSSQQSNHPIPNFLHGFTKTDDLGKLSDLTQSNFKPHITITPKNINKSFSIGGNSDIKVEDSVKNPEINSSQDFGCNFSSTDEAENFSDLQCLQNEKEEANKDSGISLPKIPRISSVTVNLGKNEPDLSKLVGISIERKKKVDYESQTSKALIEGLTGGENINPNISIQRITPKESINFSSNIDFPVEEKFLKNNTFKSVNTSTENDSLNNIDKDFNSSVKNLTDDFSQPAFNIFDNKKSETEGMDTYENKLDETTKQEGEMLSIERKNDIQDDEAIIKKEVDDKEGFVKEEMEDESEMKEPDISDFVCTDLVELMQKGEIEGEIEDVKDEDQIVDEMNEKSGIKRKSEDDIDEEAEEGNEEGGSEGGEENNCGKNLKKKKKTENSEEEDEEEEEKDEDENEENKDKNIDKSKVTNANLRKNIREVMDETKLDEATLSAQRQEAERLKRLQEQQRIIREVQRQIALNRQNQKSQNKVLSLLQGNSQTSILKTSSTSTQVQNLQSKFQNSVLVKLSNGEQTSLNNKKMIELLKNSKNKSVLGKPCIPKTLFKQGMVTPSVSIAPVIKKDLTVDEKKKKKGDVVTLSSDSEDDCIVLSDEDESEPEEDPTNSGMHTNDKYNFPDEQGRVLVNVGHPESETDLYLAPQIAKIIKPHQIGGIRFLYDNVIESIERFPTSSGFGCILAHSMGLGKTLQIVSFSDIFLRYTSAKTILCIMPINTIQNWLAEFNMWLPKESAAEDVRCREFDLFIVNESLKNIHARAKVILEWKKSGGVLLMGYELFRLLSLKKSHKSKKKKKDMEEDDAKNKELVEEVYSALVIPGPDLVICDEGHRIKNSHATTSQALKQIRTKRRIVLTGYPLQNNLLEYWCMVDFVRPNYLGTKTEFSNMFERPIQNGQCIDSTPQDKRLMRYRAHVLHSLLEGFVQRRSHAVLQSTLPEKEEYVLLLRFTPFQRKLYDTFMNEVVRTVAVPNPLKAFAVCCKIWNHPDVLYNFLKKKGEEIDLDLEEALPPSLQIPQYPYGQQSMGLDAANQQQNWPRRGPGSRGGKTRQNARKAQCLRGRKPAATVTPNMSGEQEKINEPYGSGQYSGVNEFPAKNFSNQSSESNVDNFQNRNYNQSQFGYGNDYDSQPNYGNAHYNKSTLNNLEEISTGNFQGKRFFSQNNDSGSQVHNYGNPENFDSGRPEARFNQATGNDSNITSSFNSNLRNSTYNQTEPTKPFDFNQEFNSSNFYPSENFQNSSALTTYPRDNKPSVFQNSSYYQNSNFRNADNFEYSSGNTLNASFPGYQRPNSNFSISGNNTNFQHALQRSNSGQRVTGGTQVSNFQSQNLENTFQNSSSTTNSSFSNNFQTSASNFERNRFSTQTNNSTSFQGANSNFDLTRNKGFQEGSDASFEMNRSKNSNFQSQNSQAPNFQSGNYDQNYWSQSSNWGYSESSKTNQNFRSTSATNDYMPQQKFNSFDETQDSNKPETKNFTGGNHNSAIYPKVHCDYSSTSFEKTETESKMTSTEFEEGDGTKSKEEDDKKEETKSAEIIKKEDNSLPYDWATDLYKTYVTGVIENSSKMEVFVHIVTESIKLGDRLLVFSQSLLTLDLIESYLHRQNVPGKEETWAKSRNYFRLDGSTPGLEREKLINEFNSNPNIHLFLVSTRAGSLGINLVGANRVIVFDASWNPCHDTQAVCRVYRYGQQKPCYVYRLVMDSCLEKKIYDRQVNKQGMADRVVDELNPDAHLSIKEVTNLCWDDQEDTTVKDFSHLKDKYSDEIIKILLERCSKVLSKEPFQHESLLIDRKEKKLSQAEKRLAKRSYELEKQAANQPKNLYSFFPNANQRNFVKPIASVRPMQSEMNSKISPQIQNRSKWIPADVWQKQGMSAQEMTLPLDVVIPTSSPEKTSIVLKAGQRVMVLKSPKGIYMQLENGKIIAIRSAFKVGQNSSGDKHEDIKKVKSTGSITVTPKMAQGIRQGIVKQPFSKPFVKFPEKKPPVTINMIKGKQVMGKTKPFLLNRKFENVTADVKQRLMGDKSSFNNQESKLYSGEPAIVEEKSSTPEKSDLTLNDGSFTSKTTTKAEAKTEEKVDEKSEMVDSLETLRKVTEKISDSTKREAEPETEPEIQFQKSSPLNYRHNFTSQVKENLLAVEDKATEVANTTGITPSPQPLLGAAVVGNAGTITSTPTNNRINTGVNNTLNRTSTGAEGLKNRTASDVTIATNIETSTSSSACKEEKKEMNSTVSGVQQQGNENIQNWLMNQSYPSMDPYGNYFSGYYAYGPGPTPMMPPYDGFYSSNNYGHSVGRNTSVVSPNTKPQQPEVSKSSSQSVQPTGNSAVQKSQSSTSGRNSSVVNTPPMYPPYPNPYPYHYNYSANPNFGSQGFSFSNQNSTSQQTTSTTATTTAQSVQSSSTTNTGHSQSAPYDNSMYSAFHRPDATFQTPENPYPSPYPRPPYPSSATPGFFPYNPPYPNYPYGHNFNPYMHPTGYGYSMQNHPSSAGQGSGSNAGISGGGSIGTGAGSVIPHNS